MKTLTVRTHQHKQVIDITDEVCGALRDLGAAEGVCHLSLLHTTAALTTADLDPGTDQDLLDAYEAMLPRLKYRHPHDPSHVGEHIMSSVLGTSLCLPVQNGRLLLGTWQRVVLVELGGPRHREIAFSFLEE